MVQGRSCQALGADPTISIVLVRVADATYKAMLKAGDTFRYENELFSRSLVGLRVDRREVCIFHECGTGAHSGVGDRACESGFP